METRPAMRMTNAADKFTLTYNMCPSDPNMIRNIKASIDMVVNTPQVNDWDWIDAIQMAMPIYAKFGKMTGEQKYYD